MNNDIITSDQIQSFLSDYRQNSETQILEQAKEVNDILEVAEARGYNLKNREALAGFKTIYAFADMANKNKARLPKVKLLKILPEIIGTPIDIDHIRDYVVGHYIDYRYIASEDKIIAYGVFYKSNFADEWETAKKLFKSGKLGTSYEIFCPKSKRKYLADGTYQLTKMEIAGGALLFKEKPAFEDAMVLEVAKKNIKQNITDLVTASEKQYDNDELILSSEAVMEAPVETEEPVKVDELIDQQPPVQNQIPKLLCKNCNVEFDNVGDIALQSEKKCPNCKAIVDVNGEVVHPPQIIDFKCECTYCHMSNWKILNNSESSATVQCVDCMRKYNLSFSTLPESEIMNKIAFLYQGRSNCPQCGQNIPYSTTSKVQNMELTCPACELNYTIDISKASRGKKILKIEELVDVQKASLEGGESEMDQENKQETKPEDENKPVVSEESTETVVQDEKPTEPTVENETVVPEPTSEETQPESKEVSQSEKVDEKPEEKVGEETPVSEENKTDEEPQVETPAEPVVEEAKAEVIDPKDFEQLKQDYAKAVAKNEKYKGYFKAACKKVKAMKKELNVNKASVDENVELKAKVELLEGNAVKIIERKNVLGDFGKDLSEKDILDDDKFEMAKVKKENADLKAQLDSSSSHISVKSEERSDAFIAETAKAIDDLAFPKK